MIRPWSNKTTGSCTASIGLDELGFIFQPKGGTSLSKGHQVINRFWEDIDILIEPFPSQDVKAGKNHDSAEGKY